MDFRQTAAADALGSTRAEGLEPSEETLALIHRHVRGEITDADLSEARRQMVEAATLPHAATN